MKLALAQMLVEGGAPERNLVRARARIAEAAARHRKINELEMAEDLYAPGIAVSGTRSCSMRRGGKS